MSENKTALPPADYRSIPVDAIDIGPRLRELSGAHVEHIAKAMTEYGRLAPIIVRAHPTAPDRFILVAGLHRLTAARSAGRSEIDADVRSFDDEQARAVEAAENLYRYELTILDRAKSLRALDEAVTPHRARGRGGDRRSKNVLAIDLFADLEAEVRKRIKLSGRAIRRDIALVESLDPDVVKLISGTEVADNQAQLRKLATLAPKDQRRVAEAIAAGGGFRAALDQCGYGAPKLNKTEAERRTAVDAWSRWSDTTKRFVLLQAGFTEAVIDTVIPPDGRRRKA
ncbi:ParB/RepB/Spo0J family partition protein [Rhodoplanes serenus]|nr:ParB/RepB/Spo0J family partition protein [Rhodoplanes serenus]